MDKILNEIYVGYKDGKPYRRNYKKMIYFNLKVAKETIDEYVRRDASLEYKGDWINLSEDEKNKLIEIMRNRYTIKVYKCNE